MTLYEGRQHAKSAWHEIVQTFSDLSQLCLFCGPLVKKKQSLAKKFCGQIFTSSSFHAGA
jgi:hypothetical protein